MNKNIKKYYAEPGIMTELSNYSLDSKEIPSKIKDIVEYVQSMIIHSMWLTRCSVEDNISKRLEANCKMDSLVSLQKKMDGSTFIKDREPQDKIIACCREFSLLFCAVCRLKGFSARARCGFSLYLAEEGKYEDHWVCEVLMGDAWRMVDPQIDKFQLTSIKDWAHNNTKKNSDYLNILLTLDPLNITEKHFMLAGEAWIKSRAEEISPESFGISIDPATYNLKTFYGLWFIRGNLIRDFLALNKIEISPYAAGLRDKIDYWDDWRLMSAKDDELTNDDLKLLDNIAELTLSPDDKLGEIFKLYQKESALHPPKHMLTNKKEL